MFEFFDNFFKSALAKNNVISIIIIIAVLIAIGALLMWLYMSKIHLKLQINKIQCLEDLLKQKDKTISDLNEQLMVSKHNLSELMSQSEEFAFFNQLQKSADENDPAIQEFVHD